MCSKLFIALSSVALLGMSAVAFSEVMPDTWAWYSFDANNKLISRPAGQIPQSDCLEMICDYGCVEKNNLYGYCCPGNGQCRVESGEDVDLCCGDGRPCIKGVCGCPTGTTEYIGIENTKDCCDDMTHVLSSIPDSTNQACCPKETPIWDATQKKCVECVTNTDCKGDGQVCQTNVCTCPAGTLYIEGSCYPSCLGTYYSDRFALDGRTECPKNEPLCNKECHDNSDCGGINSGYFCFYANYVRDRNREEDCLKTKLGLCQRVKDYEYQRTKTKYFGTLVNGKRMDYWTAKNWCQAQGLNMINVDNNKLACHYEKIGTREQGVYCSYGGNARCCAGDCSIDYKHNIHCDYTEQYKETKKAQKYNGDHYWTSTSSGVCDALTVGTAGLFEFRYKTHCLSTLCSSDL